MSGNEVKEEEVEVQENSEVKKTPSESGEKVISEAKNNSQKLHPCLRVYGTCNYARKELKEGDEEAEKPGPSGITGCMFEEAPYDACLKYLKGHCPRGRGCSERHVKYFEGSYISTNKKKSKHGKKDQNSDEDCFSDDQYSSSDEDGQQEEDEEEGDVGEDGEKREQKVHKERKNRVGRKPRSESTPKNEDGTPKYHPCLRVYGKCNFENADEPCVYKDAPYDACLQYLKGHCPRGRNCTERHVRQIQRGLFVDVVPRAAIATADSAKADDVPKADNICPTVPQPGEPAPTNKLHPCLRVFGTCNYNGGGADGERHPCVYAKAPYDACLQYLKGHCPRGRNCTERHVVWLAHKGIYVNATTPGGSGGYQQPQHNFYNQGTQQGFYAGPKGHAATQPYSGKKHPCLRVYGRCNFENAAEPCVYREAPYDACLQYLKGHCMRGSSCKELHCNPSTFAIVQTTQYQATHGGGYQGQGGNSYQGGGGGGQFNSRGGGSQFSGRGGRGGGTSSGGGRGSANGRQDRSGVLVPAATAYASAGQTTGGRGGKRY